LASSTPVTSFKISKMFNHFLFSLVLFLMVIFAQINAQLIATISVSGNVIDVNFVEFHPEAAGTMILTGIWSGNFRCFTKDRTLPKRIPTGAVINAFIPEQGGTFPVIEGEITGTLQFTLTPPVGFTCPPGLADVRPIGHPQISATVIDLSSGFAASAYYF